MSTRERTHLDRLIEAERARAAQFLDDLVATFRCGTSDEIQQRWRALQVQVEDTLALEAARADPSGAAKDPARSAALHAEHARIRAQLRALGEMLELHRLRVVSAHVLAAMLHRHARHEDALVRDLEAANGRRGS